MPRGARRAGAASRSCTSYAGARAARSQGAWPPGARLEPGGARAGSQWGPGEGAKGAHRCLPQRAGWPRRMLWLWRVRVRALPARTCSARLQGAGAAPRLPDSAE